MRLTLFALILLLTPALGAQDVAVRVKDIVTYKGTAANSLVGEGLVVGLKGTGDDKDKTTQKMLQAMSHKFNKAGLAPADYATKNVARVLVSVDVPAFKGNTGAALICRVSVLDKSKSIENGVLFATVLKNALDADDAAEYAQASGKVTLAQSGDKPKDPLNGTVRGSMLGDIKVAFFQTAVDDYGRAQKRITLLLDHPDSATANDIADRINEHPALSDPELEVKAGDKAPAIARAVNDGAVEVNIPSRWHGEEMKFKQLIDGVSVNPDLAATVTVDTSTGVLTFSGNVRVLPGAFTVKGISVTIGAGGELPAKPAPGEVVKGATVPVNEPNLQLRQLIDTFNLLKLDAAEKTAVVRALEQNGMLQAKVIYE